MTTEKFWGDECRRSCDYVSDARGVILNEIRMLASVYATAQRIYDAGPDGVATGSVSLTDVNILQSAKIDVRTDSIGSRYWIDHLPEPQAWLTPVPKEPPRRVEQIGPCPPFRPDYSAPKPWS